MKTADTVVAVASRALDIVGGPGLLVHRDLSVVRATHSASVLRFVSGRTVTRKKVAKLVRRAIDSTTPVRERLKAHSPTDQEPRVIDLRAVRIAPDLVLIIGDDVTEERQADSIRREFIANVTHELKTPIGAISLLGEAIEGARDDPQRLISFAASLAKETQRLSTLVSDVIQLSRVETLDLLSDAAPVNVALVLVEARERTLVQADARHIDVELGQVDDAFVMGDGELIATAITNLVSNAINYSEEGTRIRVGVKATRRTVKISVADEGIGIPFDEQERIFERFYRIDDSRSRATGGTGLGLSLVKHIVLGHHGEIDVVSEPGHGSTFTVRLPRFTRSIEGTNK